MIISTTNGDAIPMPHAETEQTGTFPAGSSELAARIRAFDWSQTSLGPIAGWSQSLKTSVNLILQSPVPIVTLWGGDGIMIYNDAYATFAGRRHPTLLGAKVLSGWPEVADFNQHVMEVGLNGGTLSYRDQHLVLYRAGVPEDVWMDLTYSPILDEYGLPVGIMAIVVETTSRVVEERRRKLVEERLQLALDGAGMIGVCEYHIPSDKLYADARFAELFSVDVEQAAQGVSLAEYLKGIHPEDVERITSAVQHTIATRERYQQEYRLLRRTGEIRWVFVRGNIFDDENGQPTRFLAVVVDITEQKYAEAVMRESQHELQLITDELPELVGYVDRTLTYRFVNRAYEQWFGLPREAILGRTIPDVVGPQVYAQRKAGLERALAGEEVRFEAVLEMGDRQRNTELRLFPRRSADGAVQGVYIFVLDISDRKRAEDALRQLNEVLEQEVQARTRERDQIWNVSQDLLGIADLEGRWRSINPAWRRNLGWTEAEIIGRTSEWMEHPDDRAQTRKEVAVLAARNSTRHFENRFRTKDGTYRWLSWTTVREDELLYCVARDVTAEKARQAELEQMQQQLRQAQKMEAIGQLTGGIAHDFNNMLTGIIASLDLLQRRIAAGRFNDVDRYVTTATTSAKRAATLTHRLLAFGRQQSLDVQPTDVNRLILSLEDLLQRTMGESIVFETMLESEIFPALTDANQLENALLNLCINARDAMPHGGRLTIATSEVHLDEMAAHEFGDLEPGDYVLMRVSDTGTGMPPEVVERAFDPFFTTKPIGQGTGLGLSMIYGFVKQSGGHVHIDSVLGQGTTVHLYLPRYVAALDAAPTAESNGQSRGAAGECVLVVEDDPAVRMVVVEVLEDLGYRALEADDAQSAIPRIASEQRIDLLITDVGLPGMNGRQLAEIARQQRPDLPILFVTGYAEGAATRSGFLEPGMDLISKPFDIDALDSKIRSMLE